MKCMHFAYSRKLYQLDMDFLNWLAKHTALLSSHTDLLGSNSSCACFLDISKPLLKLYWSRKVYLAGSCHLHTLQDFPQGILRSCSTSYSKASLTEILE